MENKLLSEENRNTSRGNAPRIRNALLCSSALLLSACLSGGRSDNTSANQRADAFESTACNEQSWVAGTTELCEGHLVYRDYVYDDYGADLGLLAWPFTLLNLTTRLGPTRNQPTLLAPAAGDISYPEGLVNTADLVRLDISIEGDDLVVEFLLNTLYQGNETIAALAIDTDNDSSTGGGAWTGLVGVRSQGWDELHLFEQGDPDTNIISGRIPRPRGDQWRVQAVLAQADGQVMNVAFRGIHEEAAATVSILSDGLSYLAPDKGSYWEDKQATALAHGDISPFGAVVTASDLTNGVTKKAPPIGAGLYQRVYTSAYTLPPGEGVGLSGPFPVGPASGSEPGRSGVVPLVDVCTQVYHYFGKYQPYAFYVPDSLSRSNEMPGAQLVLHGCQANHASKIHQAGFQEAFGESSNRYLISPLGRGPTAFYSDFSERDVMDVLADVRENYAFDQDNLLLSGYSMGGYGSLRLAGLYPDLFAGIINWVGHTGHILTAPVVDDLLVDIVDALPLPPSVINHEFGAVGNPIEFLGNLQHIPGVHVYGALDELVFVTQALALQQRLMQENVPHHFHLHPVLDHLMYLILDEWQRDADLMRDARRVINPARVRYRTDLSLGNAELGLFHDRAYWLSEIEGRAEGYIDLDLTSRGCGHPDTVLTSGTGAGLIPTPWVSTSLSPSDSLAVAPENSLSGSIANLSYLTLDSDGACLAPGTQYAIESDGDAVIQFTDGRRLELTAGMNQGQL